MTKSMTSKIIIPLLGYLLTLILLIAQGCNSDGSDDLDAKKRELDAAKACWSTQKIESYEYTIVYGGFHPPDSLRIIVNENQVVRIIDLSTQLELVSYSNKTIDDLFIEIDKNLYSNSLELTLKFNDSTGYPEKVYFDGGEEGWGYEIVHFKDLTGQ